jgi:hypothetical protein
MLFPTAFLEFEMNVLEIIAQEKLLENKLMIDMANLYLQIIVPLISGNYKTRTP